MDAAEVVLIDRRNIVCDYIEACLRFLKEQDLITRKRGGEEWLLRLSASTAVVMETTLRGGPANGRQFDPEVDAFIRGEWDVIAELYPDLAPAEALKRAWDENLIVREQYFTLCSLLGIQSEFQRASGFKRWADAPLERWALPSVAAEG